MHGLPAKGLVQATFAAALRRNCFGQNLHSGLCITVPEAASSSLPPDDSSTLPVARSTAIRTRDRISIIRVRFRHIKHDCAVAPVLAPVGQQRRHAADCGIALPSTYLLNKLGSCGRSPDRATAGTVRRPARASLPRFIEMIPLHRGERALLIGIAYPTFSALEEGQGIERGQTLWRRRCLILFWGEGKLWWTGMANAYIVILVPEHEWQEYPI